MPNFLRFMPHHQLFTLPLIFLTSFLLGAFPLLINMWVSSWSKSLSCPFHLLVLLQYISSQSSYLKEWSTLSSFPPTLITLNWLYSIAMDSYFLTVKPSRHSWILLTSISINTIILFFVLVHSGCCNGISKTTELINNKNLFLTVEAWKSMIKASVDSSHWQIWCLLKFPYLIHRDNHLLPMTSHGRRVRELFDVSFITAPITFLKALPSWPKHLPRAHLQMLSYQGLGFNMWIREDTQVSFPLTFLATSQSSL